MKLKPCRICGRTNMRIKTAVIANVDLICVACKCGERSNIYQYNADEIDQTLHRIAVEIWNNRPHYSERTDPTRKERYDDVKAWMPLPELPKEGEHNGTESIGGCLDCVHSIDKSGQCLIAKMFEKPVVPEHGCSWRVPIKRKGALTNADRIRAMTDEELAEFFFQISQCCGNDASCSMCPIYDGCAQNVMCVERWLKQCATDTNVGGKGGAENDKT